MEIGFSDFTHAYHELDKANASVAVLIMGYLLFADRQVLCSDVRCPIERIGLLAHQLGEL